MSTSSGVDGYQRREKQDGTAALSHLLYAVMVENGGIILETTLICSLANRG